MVLPALIGQLNQERRAFGAALGLYNNAMIVLRLTLSRLLEPVHQNRRLAAAGSALLPLLALVAFPPLTLLLVWWIIASVAL